MSIQTIAIVHHVHTDFGYTDYPCRTKREHMKYINQAVDYILASSNYPEGSRFAWTQEQLYPIREWWESATETEKDRFFQALATGRLEITGTPFNVTAFLSREEWEAAMNWIPEDLWERCNIKRLPERRLEGMDIPRQAQRRNILVSIQANILTERLGADLCTDRKLRRQTLICVGAALQKMNSNTTIHPRVRRRPIQGTAMIRL